MAKEPGDMFRCDRSPEAHKDGKPVAVFLNEYDKRRDDWDEVTWTDTNNVRITYMLCPECLAEYKSMSKKQNAQTQEFMYQGQ